MEIEGERRRCKEGGQLWKEGVGDEWGRDVDVNEGWAVNSEGGIL